MKLRIKNFSYDTSHSREKFARYLTRVIDPSTDCAPYMPNGNGTDHSFWRVDVTGNNWTLTFKEDGSFYIGYRYDTGNPEVEKALFNWLKVKMYNLELITE